MIEISEGVIGSWLMPSRPGSARGSQAGSPQGSQVAGAAHSDSQDTARSDSRCHSRRPVALTWWHMHGVWLMFSQVSKLVLLQQSNTHRSWWTPHPPDLWHGKRSRSAGCLCVAIPQIGNCTRSRKSQMAAQELSRPTYLRVLVSTLIVSPSLMKSGAWITAPVSIVTSTISLSLPPWPDAPPIVSVTLYVTTSGICTSMGLPFQ